VRSVSFSPNGKLLDSGSHDRTIKLWNVPSGVFVRTLEGHIDIVRSVSFSPDGQLLASGSHDGTIKLWNGQSGACVRTLTGPTGDVMSVSFSPEGQLLACGSHSKPISLWNVQSGACENTVADRFVVSVSFSPDGQLLASVSGKTRRVSVNRLWHCDPTDSSSFGVLEKCQEVDLDASELPSDSHQKNTVARCDRQALREVDALEDRKSAARVATSVTSRLDSSIADSHQQKTVASQDGSKPKHCGVAAADKKAWKASLKTAFEDFSEVMEEEELDLNAAATLCCNLLNGSVRKEEIKETLKRMDYDGNDTFGLAGIICVMRELA